VIISLTNALIMSAKDVIEETLVITRNSASSNHDDPNHDLLWQNNKLNEPELTIPKRTTFYFYPWSHSNQKMTPGTFSHRDPRGSMLSHSVTLMHTMTCALPRAYTSNLSPT